MLPLGHRVILHLSAAPISEPVGFVQLLQPLDRGADVCDISRNCPLHLRSVLMGHASTASTDSGPRSITDDCYTHVLPGEIERAGEQFEAYLLAVNDRAGHAPRPAIAARSA
jgi:hypothetical protein